MKRLLGERSRKINIPRQKLTILAKVLGTVPDDQVFPNWFFEAELRKIRHYINQGV
jgi:hypothetical protein